MRKVKWGVLGTASIAKGQTIPGMIKADNCELYAIAGRSLEKAEEFKATFGFEKVYGSYMELLEDPEVEAVYIPLPNNLHKEWAVKAAQHKKHILCEKPLSGNPNDVKDIIDVCDKEGVIIMEAFAYLHSPLVEKIKEQIDTGVVGDVNFIESCFYTHGYEDNIRIHRETLGGSIYDLGCYNITFATALFGEMPIESKAVAHFSKNGIDETSTGYLLFNNDKKAIFSCAMHPYSRGDRTFVYGKEGIIEIPIAFNAEGVQKWYVVKGDERTEYSIDIPNNYMLEVEQLGRCITDRESPLVSHEFSIGYAETMKELLDSCGYNKY